MRLPYISYLTPDDYDQWRKLYQGYADFHHVVLTKDGVQITWSWLIDDLFVVPGHRSGGAAVALITAVQAEAKAKAKAEDQGWGVVRWIALENNYWARGLHEKLAEKTNWLLYEMTKMAAK